MTWGFGDMSVFEHVSRSILDTEASLVRRLCVRHQLVRFFIEKWALLYTILIEIFVPDKLILYYLNILDRIVKPHMIGALIKRVAILLSPKARSSLIEVADYCDLNTAANSRKICAIIAYTGKYIPDWMIPQEAADAWSNLKLKFHVPTLLSREPHNLVTKT
jgi:hypothetical protein